MGIGNKEKFKAVLSILMKRNDNTVRHRVEYAQSYLEWEENPDEIAKKIKGMLGKIYSS